MLLLLSSSHLLTGNWPAPRFTRCSRPEPLPSPLCSPAPLPSRACISKASHSRLAVLLPCTRRPPGTGPARSRCRSNQTTACPFCLPYSLLFAYVGGWGLGSALEVSRLCLFQ